MKPFGYFHQLLDHEQKPNGVWLGCDDRKATEQAHIDGETDPAIVVLYEMPRELLQQARDALLDAQRNGFTRTLPTLQALNDALSEKP